MQGKISGDRNSIWNTGKYNERLPLEKIWKLLKNGFPYILLVIVFIWNYSELTYEHTAAACCFLQNMKASEMLDTCSLYGMKSWRLILHSFYHNISESSLKNAASFFSLFALVIAMIQTIYPYRLGKIHDYPIAKLDGPPISKEKFRRLLVCAVVIIVTEFLMLNLVEVCAVLIGYALIMDWLCQVVKWYKKYENDGAVILNKAKEDLRKLLKNNAADNCSENNYIKRKDFGYEQAEDDLKEILERNTKIDGIEEREILKQLADILANPGCGVDHNGCRCIFEYSFYFAHWLVEECEGTLQTTTSWHYKMLKKELLKTNYKNSSGEYFIKGVLLGILSSNNLNITEGCLKDILPVICKNMNDIRCFSELIGCICVFLELYCNVNEEALYMADLLVSDPCLDEAAEFHTEDVKIKMTECYHFLLDLDLVDAIEEYDVVKALQTELKGRNDKIPQTILGRLYAFCQRM